MKPSPCPFCYRPWQPEQVQRNSEGIDPEGHFEVDFEWVCPICGRVNKGQLQVFVNEDLRVIEEFRRE